MTKTDSYNFDIKQFSADWLRHEVLCKIVTNIPVAKLFKTACKLELMSTWSTQYQLLTSPVKNKNEDLIEVYVDSKHAYLFSFDDLEKMYDYLLNKPAWPSDKKWRYRALERDNYWYFYGKEMRFHDHAETRHKVIAFPAGYDWRLSLERRPDSVDHKVSAPFINKRFNTIL